MSVTRQEFQTGIKVYLIRRDSAAYFRNPLKILKFPLPKSDFWADSKIKIEYF